MLSERYDVKKLTQIAEFIALGCYNVNFSGYSKAVMRKTLK
jgi:hypothetical protein